MTENENISSFVRCSTPSDGLLPASTPQRGSAGSLGSFFVKKPTVRHTFLLPTLRSEQTVMAIRARLLLSNPWLIGANNSFSCLMVQDNRTPVLQRFKRFRTNGGSRLLNPYSRAVNSGLWNAREKIVRVRNMQMTSCCSDLYTNRLKL